MGVVFSHDQYSRDGRSKKKKKKKSILKMGGSRSVFSVRWEEYQYFTRSVFSRWEEEPTSVVRGVVVSAAFFFFVFSLMSGLTIIHTTNF